MASREEREQVFLGKLKEKWGDEYELVGKYEKSNEKVEIYHKICDKTFTITPASILKGTRCSHCYLLKKKTTEEFQEELKEKYGEKYLVLENYVNAKTKIKIKHTDCGYEWEDTPNHILRKRKKSPCPKCNKTIRKDTVYYKKEIEEMYSGEYTILGEYVASSKHILTRHNEKHCDNHEWYVTPSNLLRGYGCPVCGLKKIGDFHRKSEEDFLAKVREVHGNKYEVLSPFKGVHEYVEVLHKECGKTWDIIPLSLQRGIGCNHCYGTHRKTTDQYKEEIRLQTNGAYEVIGEYINARTPIKIRHIEDGCNHEFEGIPNVLMYSISCGACNGSSGEKAVAAYLKDKGYKFDAEHRFDDCRNVYPLSFDFAVFNSDGTLNCLIEYDGQQHYKPVDYWEGEEGLKKYQMRDGIKNDYCERNNIKLIRIPYWEFKNINTILDKEVKIY